jgi:TP901 family phage tail tape measure protein
MATGFSVFVNIGGKVDSSLATAVNATKSQVKGLASSLAGIGARLNAPFIAANKHLDRTAKHLSELQRKGRNASLGFSTPATWFGANLIKDAAEFAKAGNMVEALGEATTEQRNQLSSLSQDLAKRYDAGGAAGILKSATELLKAGFTFEQARGALEQVLAASALAGDMTPADVGASLSKTVTQFQMPMKTFEDAMKSSKTVTDRMVYAAVSTVASMKDVAETMKYAGGVAASTGNSLDQVTAIMMSFAKAGVLGSEAGVALRSAIVRMVKMPKGGLAALSRIGMNLSDYVQARPVTADGVIGSLKADGIDASKAKKQIEGILKNRGNKDQATVTAEITKAVQGALGSSSAVDAAKIAETISEAVNAAGSKIDITKFFTDLKAKFDAGIATTGDIAQILEARHISRYMAILKSDLNKLVEQIGKEAEGYSERQYLLANKGLPAALVRLNATWAQLKNTIAESVGEELTDTFANISDKMERLSKSSPKTFKLGVALAAAAVAAGPLLFALSAIGRILIVAFKGVSLAVMGLNLLSLALLAPIARIGAMILGLKMLFALGARTALAVLAGSLLSLGKAILLFPLVALRGIAVAMAALMLNPVGLVFTGIVAALAALGVWVANNWEGLKSFFAGFGDGFMKGLGPASGAIKSISDGLGSAFNWLGKLLGPLDESGAKWKSWGETMGGAVAQGVNAVINGIKSLIGFFGTVIEKAVALGGAIRNLWSGGGGPRPAAPPPIAGARALGGPVTYGKPYLVGERGPELFVPGATGRIETNGALRQMTENGTAAAATTASYASSKSTVNNAKIDIHVRDGGNSDPRAIGREAEAAVYRVFARLESEQRGLLSD